MRKAIVVALVLGLVAGSLAAPAAAGKGQKKKVHETFGADLLPWPKLAAWGEPIGFTKPGCSSGQENVHWVAQEFKSPGKGTLRFWMEGFVGDHDIYIYGEENPDIPLARSENDQTQGAPAEEEIEFPFRKGDTVTLVACNWLGHPSVEAHYEGTFKL